MARSEKEQSTFSSESSSSEGCCVTFIEIEPSLPFDYVSDPLFDCTQYEVGTLLGAYGSAPDWDFLWLVADDGAGGCVLVTLKNVTAQDQNTKKQKKKYYHFLYLSFFACLPFPR